MSLSITKFDMSGLDGFLNDFDATANKIAQMGAETILSHATTPIITGFLTTSRYTETATTSGRVAAFSVARARAPRRFAQPGRRKQTGEAAAVFGATYAASVESRYDFLQNAVNDSVSEFDRKAEAELFALAKKYDKK
jgi:hypothetical protein